MRDRSPARRAASSTLSYRHALGIFVGVDGIPNGLPDVGATNDANYLGAALSPALFRTVRVTGTEATRETILAQLENTVQESGRGDFVIAYFGGHANAMYDDVYLLPADHDRESFLATSVSLRLVSSVLGSAPDVKSLIILDLCYAGTVGFDISSYRVGSESGLMVSSGPREMALTTTGSDGRLHGTFTSALADALRSFHGSPSDPWTVALIDWFDRAYGDTVRESAGKQHPVLLGTLSPNLEIRSRRVHEIDPPSWESDG